MTGECAYHAAMDATPGVWYGVKTLRCAHFGDVFIHERAMGNDRWISRRTLAGASEGVNVCPACAADVWEEAHRRMLAGEEAHLYSTDVRHGPFMHASLITEMSNRRSGV